MNKYSVIQNSASVLTVKFEKVESGWEQWIMASSDRHHDNLLCDRELEKRQLDEALKREALICDFGDLFCAMQGKYDPRSSMDNLRPEDKVVNYLDTIVSHAYDDYQAYKQNWILLAHGNHESNIQHRHGTDLTSNLCHRMNTKGGNVHVGGIGGWLRFQFVINKTKRTTINMKYHHGSSRNPDAQVTRGVIQTNRQAVYEPDAHIIANGHSHDAYVVPISRERLSQMGVQSQDILWFIRTPGYKNEFQDGMTGWANELAKPPKPRGCIWIHLSCYDAHDGKIKIECVQDMI